MSHDTPLDQRPAARPSPPPVNTEATTSPTDDANSPPERPNWSMILVNIGALLFGLAFAWIVTTFLFTLILGPLGPVLSTGATIAVGIFFVFLFKPAKQKQ